MSPFEFRPAVRANIPLILMFSGPTGGGKTYSALRVAKGLAGGERFAYLDTENGRALHYADEFSFDHGDLSAPFSPDRYAEAVKAADDAGYPVIVVDSASHEHAGEGGLIDLHSAALDRMAGDDWKRREACSMAAWVEPKRLHKLFVSRLLQIKAHLIVCLRAEQKIEMAKDSRGRTEIRKKIAPGISLDGWTPIAERNLAFEATLSCLFLPDAPGVPKPIKMEQQHRLLVPLDQPINEDVGASLAEWARGADTDEMTQQVAELVADLLDGADLLGSRDQVTAAITRNRRLHGRDTSKHLSWLRRQQEQMDAALAAREEEDVPTGESEA